MFLLDDLVAAPVNFILWVMRQVHEAAENELEDEAEVIPTRLAELHRQLEAGQISEQDFDRQERQLLDRLDQLEQRSARH